MKVYFAPLQGITFNYFRFLFNKVFGNIDKYFTPFISTTSSEKVNINHFKDIVKYRDNSINVVPQLLTNNSNDFVRFCKIIKDLGYNEVNINLGCPFGTVTAKKKGSGFLKYYDEVDNFFENSLDKIDISVSIKIRLGFENQYDYQKLIPIFNKYNFLEIIVHPRYGKQFYSGNIFFDCFDEIYKESKNKVVYNGDIFTFYNFCSIIEKYSKLDSIMIGRGLVANPFLIYRIKNNMALSNSEKINKFVEFHNLLLKYFVENLSGEKHITDRMKGFWDYWASWINDSDWIIKKVKKIKTLSEYSIFFKHFELSNIEFLDDNYYKLYFLK